jgi:hypothetical protein
MYVYIHRIFGDFQAKNTICTPYTYGSGQPQYVPATCEIKDRRRWRYMLGPSLSCSVLGLKRIQTSRLPQSIQYSGTHALLHTRTRTHTHSHTHIRTHIHIHTRTHTYAHTYTHARTHTCAHTFTYTHVHAYLYSPCPYAGTSPAPAA